MQVEGHKFKRFPLLKTLGTIRTQIENGCYYGSRRMFGLWTLLKI